MSEQCAADLNAIPGFLLENDAGARDELAQWGQAHFDAALAKARQQVAQTLDTEGCTRELNAYLKAWRKGHLRVNDSETDSAPATVDSRGPSITLLSGRTLLLTVPSFAGAFRQPLTLLLARHRRDLMTHEDWVIDVRGNDGGDDGTFYPLLSWLVADEIEDIGIEWLSTPANIEAQRGLCTTMPKDSACEQFSAEAVKRMSGVPSGSYVPQEEGAAIHYERIDGLQPHRPARVAILVDDRCASSCEEFLLAARQSFSVKLVGTHSRGSLDYSNVRRHLLPSGKRTLIYAISRSRRLPNLPIDSSGVQPDIYLPETPGKKGPADEILEVRQWLERGRLSS